MYIHKLRLGSDARLISHIKNGYRIIMLLRIKTFEISPNYVIIDEKLKILQFIFIIIFEISLCKIFSENNHVLLLTFYEFLHIRFLSDDKSLQALIASDFYSHSNALNSMHQICQEKLLKYFSA